VELRGHYSAERICNFDAYRHATSSLWALFVCVASPFPCLLVVTAIDVAPMAPPEEVLRRTACFGSEMALRSPS
jgi:hypothetical protein